MTSERTQSLIQVFLVSVLLNYPWELAQAPLYVGLERYDSAVFWHCFVASLGDGIMVLLIALVGALVLPRWNWFQRPGIAGYLLMLTSGLVLAVSVEWVAVYQLGRWQYTSKMLILPRLNIGVVPIAQMLFLPPLIFRIAAMVGLKR